MLHPVVDDDDECLPLPFSAFPLTASTRIKFSGETAVDDELFSELFDVDASCSWSADELLELSDDFDVDVSLVLGSLSGGKSWEWLALDESSSLALDWFLSWGLFCRRRSIFLKKFQTL